MVAPASTAPLASVTMPEMPATTLACDRPLRQTAIDRPTEKQNVISRKLRMADAASVLRFQNRMFDFMIPPGFFDSTATLSIHLNAYISGFISVNRSPVKANFFACRFFTNLSALHAGVQTPVMPLYQAKACRPSATSLLWQC